MSFTSKPICSLRGCGRNTFAPLKALPVDDLVVDPHAVRLLAALLELDPELGTRRLVGEMKAARRPPPSSFIPS